MFAISLNPINTNFFWYIFHKESHESNSLPQIWSWPKNPVDNHCTAPNSNCVEIALLPMPSRTTLTRCRLATLSDVRLVCVAFKIETIVPLRFMFLFTKFWYEIPNTAPPLAFLYKLLSLFALESQHRFVYNTESKSGILSKIKRMKTELKPNRISYNAIFGWGNQTEITTYMWILKIFQKYLHLVACCTSTKNLLRITSTWNSKRKQQVPFLLFFFFSPFCYFDLENFARRFCRQNILMRL